MDIKPKDTLPSSLIRSRIAKKKAASGQSSFSPLQEEGVAHDVAALKSPFPALALDYLAEMRSFSPEKNDEGIAYSKHLMDELDALKNQLLLGNITKTHILHLTHLLNQTRIENMDERLKKLMEEIRIRAAVEIEKLSG